jgi:hypothetical protein
MADQVDVIIRDEGSFSLVMGQTGIAKAHLEERMPDDVMTWGIGYVVEPRFIDHIVDDLLANDFTVGMA